MIIIIFQRRDQTNIIIGLLQDKAELQKQLKLKEVYTDEEQRNTLQNQLNKLYNEIDALSDEKLFLSEKLFSIQENFIKKLDQQIDKTEEDKTLIERCNQDAQMEDSDLPLAGKHGKNAKCNCNYNIIYFTEKG